MWNEGLCNLSFFSSPFLCCQCDCEEGYEKDPSNLNRCKAAVGGNASLLVGFQHDIRKISIDHPDVVSPMQNVNYTQSLTVFDYSYQTNELFWCDIGQQSVFRTSIDDKDGYNRETIRHFPNNTIVNGLAVDWIYKNIYYTQCLVNGILLCAFCNWKFQKFCVGYIFSLGRTPMEIPNYHLKKHGWWSFDW